jgi:hypothetical protein
MTYHCDVCLFEAGQAPLNSVQTLNLLLQALNLLLLSAGGGLGSNNSALHK